MSNHRRFSGPNPVAAIGTFEERHFTPGRWSVVLLAYSCLAVASCQSVRESVPPAAAGTLPGSSHGTGVVVVFNPATCTITAEGFEALNRLWKEVGIPVVGVSVVPIESDSGLKRIRDGFGVAFPVIDDTLGRWQAHASRVGLSQPFVILKKRGQVHAILMGDAMERLEPLLVTLFGLGRSIDDTAAL